MQQTPIWTNPSLQRSLIQPVVVESEIEEYLKLSLSGTNTKVVKIFPDMEYNVVFYDPTYGSVRYLTGLVSNVYKDQIKFIVLNDKQTEGSMNCETCNKKDRCDKFRNRTLPPMPTCGCILNPPDNSKYKSPELVFIPLENIMDISYIQTEIPKNPPKPKKGVKVVLLGISATIVKAIVVQLEFFDDNAEKAVKLVELEKDGIYDIVYDSNGSIFESRVKVVSIEECSNKPQDCHCNTVVRENVGFNNNVYNDEPHTRDNFMMEPPVRKVKLIVDTSELFDGNLEVIMLDTIRDCTRVNTEAPDDDLADENNSIDNSCSCNCGE